MPSSSDANPTWRSLAGGVAAVQDALTDPRTRDELYYHTFVFPDYRLLYVETPKVASTSMKVALLALERMGVADLGTSDYPRPFPEAVVHDRATYPAMSLADLSEPELESAVAAPGWLRFCLVRDPFSRVFSAWESKVFVGDPGLLDRFQKLGSGDRFNGSDLDVRATFVSFTEDIAARPDFYFEDMHFRPQSRVIHAGIIPYTHVVPIVEISSFVATLQNHLDQFGLGPVISIPRLYEGLGIPWLPNYDVNAIRRVGELYAEDVAQFGYRIPEEGDSPGTRLDRIASRILNSARLSTRQVAALHEEMRLRSRAG